MNRVANGLRVGHETAVGVRRAPFHWRLSLDRQRPGAVPRSRRRTCRGSHRGILPGCFWTMSRAPEPVLPDVLGRHVSCGGHRNELDMSPLTTTQQRNFSRVNAPRPCRAPQDRAIATRRGETRGRGCLVARLRPVTPRTPTQPSDARQGEGSGSRADDEGSGVECRPPRPPGFPTRSSSGSFDTRWATTRIAGVSASASAPRQRGVSGGRSDSQRTAPPRVQVVAGHRRRHCEHVEVDRAVMVGDEALCGVIKAMHLKAQLDFTSAESNIETLTLVGSHTEGGELKLGTDGFRKRCGYSRTV